MITHEMRGMPGPAPDGCGIRRPQPANGSVATRASAGTMPASMHMRAMSVSTASRAVQHRRRLYAQKHPETRRNASLVPRRQFRRDDAQAAAPTQAEFQTLPSHQLPEVAALQLAEGEDLRRILLGMQVVRRLADELEAAE